MIKTKEVRIFSVKNPHGKKGEIPTVAFELSRQHGKRTQNLPQSTRKTLRNEQAKSRKYKNLIKNDLPITETRKRFGGYRIPVV